MTFRRHIALVINNTKKKISNKGVRQTIKKNEMKNSEIMIVAKDNSTPFLKRRYSHFWRFHHGDEL